MNHCQHNETAHLDTIKESSAHVKRKWNESFLLVDQVTDTDGPTMKVPHTSPSTVSSDTDNSGRYDLEEEDEDIKVKRKAQNRAAQRAFRERKERYVKDLEIKIKQVQDNHMLTTNQLYQENHQLRSIICRLEAENIALKGVMPLTAASPAYTSHLLGMYSTSSATTPSMDFAHPTPNYAGFTPFALSHGFHPIQPAPPLLSPTIANTEVKRTQHKPLAAKPPVPILPQQQQQQVVNSTSSLQVSQPSPALPSSSPSSSSQTQTQSSTKKLFKSFQTVANHPQKHHHQQQTQDQTPQQFTFSISTPATLRADTSDKNVSLDPIELIPLYHPDHGHVPPSYNNTDTIQSSSTSITLSSTSSSTCSASMQDADSPQSTTIKSPPTHLVESTDELGLSNEISAASFLDGYDVFERLYVHQEPCLFDHHGLDLSMIQSRRNSITDNEREKTLQEEHKEIRTSLAAQEEYPSSPSPAKQEELEELEEPKELEEKVKREADEEAMKMMIIKDKKMDTLLKGQKSKAGSADGIIILSDNDFDHLVDLPLDQQYEQQQHQQTLDCQQPPLHRRTAGPGLSTAATPSPLVMEDDEKTPIWQKITEHAQNNKFSVDHLVEAVRSTTTSKRKNKLLVDEWELEAMMNELNYYL